MELSAGFAVAAGGVGGGDGRGGGGDGAGGNGGDGGSGVPVVERLWTYGDVATYLGMSVAWIRREVTRRRFAGVRKLGRATRFVPSEVIAWAMSRPVRN